MPIKRSIVPPRTTTDDFFFSPYTGSSALTKKYPRFSLTHRRVFLVLIFLAPDPRYLYFVGGRPFVLPVGAYRLRGTRSCAYDELRRFISGGLRPFSVSSFGRFCFNL